MKKSNFIVLSIEDSEPDFILLKKALEEIQDINIDIICLKNGKETIKFLFEKEKYRKPDIIILDINLPDISGLELLKKIKQDKSLKSIPVIMFSTSDSEKDISDSYDLFANSYITKNIEIHELFKKIASLGEYWLKTSELSGTSFCFLENTNGEKENV